MFFDGISNVLTRLGLGKAAQTEYRQSLEQDWQAIYEESWVAERAIDLPVEDATRNWRKWEGDPDLVKALEDAEERIGLIPKLEKAAKQARISGRAALFIGTNIKTLDNPIQPTETVSFLNFISGRELVEQQKPRNTRLSESAETEFYTIDGVTVHKSRLILLGDGKSKLKAAYEAIRNSDSVAANIAEMVYEAKLDVYKIPELLSNIHEDADLLRWLETVNNGKSVSNAILLDAEMEYEQKQLNFAGLRDLLLTSYQIVAGAVGIPASKLLGHSVSGLNATGDNEVQDFYDLVQRVQRDFKSALVNLDLLLANEAGAPLADYKWQPLKSLSEKDQAEVTNKNVLSLNTLSEMQIFSDEELRAASGKLLGDLVEDADGVY